MKSLLSIFCFPFTVAALVLKLYVALMIVIGVAFLDTFFSCFISKK
jgi:hypothetical protein